MTYEKMAEKEVKRILGLHPDNANGYIFSIRDALLVIIRQICKLTDDTRAGGY